MSNKQRTPHPLKLTKSAEFRTALAFVCRMSGKHFLLRAGENSAFGASGARLGLIASRKAARRAVDRNRGKRLIREAFRGARTCQPGLPAMDVVVQLKNDLRKAGNGDLRRELDRLLRDASARFGRENRAVAGRHAGTPQRDVQNEANNQDASNE